MPTRGADVIAETRILVCDLCGAATPIDPLPPVLFITGASGAGKTTLYEALVGKVDEAILIDADLLWGVDPSHNDQESGYRQFRGLILHLAERLAKNGKAVVVEGSCMPDQYESLGERWYFSNTAYIGIVCSDDELERRLLARPAWRNSVGNLQGMLAFNRHITEVGPTSSPPITLLDTTSRTVDDCAAELHAWIRRQLTEPKAAGPTTRQ
jgi:chloramphenicol 3-O-phosphotransferase